jgi:hypothetical protein
VNKFFKAIIFVFFSKLTFAQNPEIITSKNAYCIKESTNSGVNFGVNLGTVSGVTNYEWDFGSSATPQLSTLQNPQNIIFSNTGLQNINLTISGLETFVIQKSIQIDEISLLGNLTADRTVICSEDNVTLSISNQRGNVQWRSSPDGFAWANVVGATTTSLTEMLVFDRFYQVQVKNGACGSEFTSVLGISVSTPTNGGRLIGPPNNRICKGTAVYLALSAYRGDILDWEKSSNQFFGWTSLSTNTGDYQEVIYDPLVFYRVKVKNGPCPIAYSTGGQISTTVCGVNASWTTTTPSPICILDASTTGVYFQDFSSSVGNTITGWYWTFENDASVKTFIGQNPPIVIYTSTGVKMINLSITGEFGASSYFQGRLTVSGITRSGILTAEKEAICLGQTANISVSGFTADRFFWSHSPDNLSFTSISGINNSVLSHLPTDTVFYKLKLKNGACPFDSIVGFKINVTPQPVNSFLGYNNGVLGNYYCKSSLIPQPIFYNSIPGSFFTSTTNLKFSNTITGQLDLINSAFGNHEVSYFIPAINGCLPVSKSYNLVIADKLVPLMSYPATDFCNSNINSISPTVTSFSGGIFVSDKLGLDINSISGVILPSMSSVDNYKVYYTIPAIENCSPNTSVGFDIAIKTTPTIAGFSYTSPVCSSIGSIAPNIVPTGGKFINYPFLEIDSLTGVINLKRTRGGERTITYAIDSSASCPGQYKSTKIMLESAQLTPSISYQYPVYCSKGSNPELVNSGLFGGYFSVPDGVSINQQTGKISLEETTVLGAVTVNFIIPQTNICPSLSASTTITITSSPTAPVLTFENCALKSQSSTDLLHIWYKNNIAFYSGYSQTLLENFTKGDYQLRVRSNENECEAFSSVIKLDSSDINCPWVNTTLVGNNSPKTLTGINSQIDISDIVLFPNPNNGIFYIEIMNENSTVNIYNDQGKLIYTSNLVFGKNKVEIPPFKGIYLVKINSKAFKIIVY